MTANKRAVAIMTSLWKFRFEAEDEKWIYEQTANSRCHTGRGPCIEHFGT